ncbi:MAG: gliding motility-associated C-terminal domain-containing protein [Flavobacteriales bacterium]|nr:gliding motility-associated C-terminal domain-containing protein [Flavobacteriales bacterium]
MSAVAAVTNEPDAHDHGPVKVRFTQNKGQWDANVLFRTGVNGATVFMERNGSSWVKFADDVDGAMHDAMEMSKEERAATILRGHAWRLRFHEPQGDLTIQAKSVLPGYENFFFGNDPSKWNGHVQGYGELVYKGVWEGIDVRYHATNGNLKYDVLLAAGADAENVAFRYEGIDGSSISKDGRLVLSTSVGEVIELQPVAFYSDGGQEPLACSYQLRNGVLRFVLPVNYDHSRPVTIDPILIASTLSGATGASNYGHCATYDSNGNIYSGARNFGPTYPATTGAFQVAMGGGYTDMSFSKYNPDGSDLIWASYLGGDDGENPHSMIVNSLGELCVLGSTSSANFPTTVGAIDNTLGGEADITVTHISADGTTLLGSTFLGGAASDGLNDMYANYGEQYRGEIFLDGANNILISTCSSSSDFPVTPGCFQTTLGGGQDGIVASILPDCSGLVYSTYIGGTSDDNALGIRLALNGDILVTGGTESTDFPVTASGNVSASIGGRDGYVVRLTPNASNMVVGTYFGTTDDDGSYFLDTDFNDDVWIYGQSDGTIPILPASTYGQATGPVFIAKLSSDLSTVLLTTTIGPSGGGFGGAVPVAFLVDVCDNIYISSYNSTPGLPTTPDALYTNGSFYLAAFEPDMTNILFGTYYGGSHVDGGTSRFDKNGIVYQGVCSGTGSLQTTAWAWATDQSIGWDIGVFKIDFGVAGVNAAGASAINTGCAPIQVDFSNESSGDTWRWDFGDGSPQVEAFEPSHLYSEPGDYLVRLIAQDSLACNLADTVYFPIQIGAQQPIQAGLDWEQVQDCTELRITAVNTSIGAPLDHTWVLSDGTEYTTDSISHVFSDEGTYDVSLIATDPTGCSQSDTITTLVTVAPIVFNFDLLDRMLCADVSSVPLDASVVVGDYTWSTGETTATIQAYEVGTYWVTVTNQAGCIGTDTVQVIEPNILELAFEVETCPGIDAALRIPLDNATSYLWDNGSTSRNREVEGIEGFYAFTVIDANGCAHVDSASVTLYDSDTQLFAPNAFTPNGDGINDTFQFTGYGDRTLDMTIFDRWGEQLYQTGSMATPWDGSYKGKPVANDVYVYVLKYTGLCTGQEEFQHTGHVTVVR